MHVNIAYARNGKSTNSELFFYFFRWLCSTQLFWQQPKGTQRQKKKSCDGQKNSENSGTQKTKKKKVEVTVRKKK